MNSVPARHLVLDLFEAGVDMMRMKLKRHYPTENEDAIEERIQTWLADKPITGVGPDEVLKLRSKL